MVNDGSESPEMATPEYEGAVTSQPSATVILAGLVGKSVSLPPEKVKLGKEMNGSREAPTAIRPILVEPGHVLVALQSPTWAVVSWCIA
ncbi:unnamed protein product [Parascedosporium putredinis]|uniref:Uncharacterized protein n=1 Tax=Parascedosporium putredinis TaxID=1442378 RepID=A0A9P1MBU4_9PEZI|nr:unnamed protein product [Parascedosporium putredinis]CAI7996457.1 unnamed protein product [Parascedosporium putredinis]